MSKTSADPRYQDPAWKNRRNYYRILHVQPDAPVEIIKSSYRTLMQKLKQHPDLGGEHWNATLVNEAYATLSSSTKRASYDEQLLARTLDPDGENTAQSSSQRAEETRDAKSGRPGEYEPKLRSYCSFCKTPYSPSAKTFPESECADCGSPMFPAVKLRIPSSDRRAVERTPRHHGVRYYTTWPQRTGYTGETEDISVNGMRFVASERMTEGQFLKIQCDVCSAVARVTNCTVENGPEPGRWLVGVDFVTLRFENARGVFVSAEV